MKKELLKSTLTKMKDWKKKCVNVDNEN